MKKLVTKSKKETQLVASNLAKKLRLGTILCLTGELGSGKTTFIQGFARGLGITRRIVSPTFLIVRRYTIPKAKIENHFYHIDLYRIKKLLDLEDLGLGEFIKDNRSIVAIEWPDRLGKELPKKRIDISLEYISKNKRRIVIEKIGYE